MKLVVFYGPQWRHKDIVVEEAFYIVKCHAEVLTSLVQELVDQIESPVKADLVQRKCVKTAQ
eukprot:15233617-Ditylum_brightwellii.AAC.1